MKSKSPEKMLAAFALVLLVVCATEGRIINKCELKAQLDAAQLQQITAMEETITVNGLIARLVCKASISAFNTSFVKNITAHNKEIKPAHTQVASQVPPQTLSSRIPPQASPRRAPPQTPSSGAPPQASSHRGPPQTPSSGAPPQVPAGAPPKDAPPGAPSQASPRRAPPQTPSSGAPPQASSHRGPPQAPSSGAPPQASSHRGPPETPSSGAPPQASPRRGPSQAPSSRRPPQAPAGAPPKATPSGAPAKAPSSRLPPQAPAGAPPKPYAQASTEEPHGSGNKTQHPHPTPAAKVVGHLYGVFQLSDQLACDPGMIPSLNVCNITCSALTDDDITDDITCLKTLANFTKVEHEEIPFDVKKIVEMMLVKECHSVVPQNYFAECV